MRMNDLGHGQENIGIDIYLSDDELCKKKYEEYKKLVRAKRDFE